MQNARIQRPPLVSAIAVALALLLLWPAWMASRSGLSGLHARPAIDYLEEQRFDAYDVSRAEWVAIETSVAEAVRLMPRNPQYLESLGWLHQLKLNLFSDELSTVEQDAHARLARDYFRKALGSRPTWPYYWGNLALEQYRRGDYASDSFSHALTNAARFGPWKNDIQRLVTDLGSGTWKSLTPPAQRAVILNVERGLQRQPQYTVAAVGSHSAWPKLCTSSEELLNIKLPYLEALCAQNRFIDPGRQSGI